MPELRLENSLVDERYEVRERLGLGSYAEIFVARDRHASGAEIVLKALNTSLQGTPEEDLEKTLVDNFQNEAVALDTVRHPHVILRLGHGSAADLRGVPFHYLALEYMPGGDLLRLCKSREGSRLRLPEALFYFRQVCEALAYAHEMGIIHRDLKPNNFLLSRDALTLKVADFGVAKITSADNTEITRVGAGIYAPPEHHPDQLEDEPGVSRGRLTAAADIYSLAKSFYTVVAGRAPSQFVRRRITSLDVRIANEMWAAPLLEVLGRATADEPSQRYASVIEFWSDLANVAALGLPSEEIETQVRPRLKVVPGDLPISPERPEFEHVLASSEVRVRVGSMARRSSSEPVLLPRRESRADAIDTRDGRRQPRIVIPVAKPIPPVSVATSEVAAETSAEPAGEEKETQWWVPALSVRESFSARMRRQVFLILIAVAFVGLLASVFRVAQSWRAPISEVEVISLNLNVRSGPNNQYSIVGTIPKGSRHRLIGKSDNGWVRIEVSQWNESLPHDQSQKSGWVNGADEYVSIVASRRW